MYDLTTLINNLQKNGFTVSHFKTGKEAAEYIDAEWEKHYAACPEFNRSKIMREIMWTVYLEAEEKYGVRINNACCP